MTPPTMKRLRPKRSPSVPARQHQAREEERVGVDHPLQARHARVERRLHIAERHRHDRRVEEGQEEDGAEGRERPALTDAGADPRSDAGGAR